MKKILHKRAVTAMTLIVISAVVPGCTQQDTSPQQKDAARAKVQAYAEDVKRNPNESPESRHRRLAGQKDGTPNQ